MNAHADTGLVIKRILRVNHAGEHGAVEIYGAQLRIMGARNPEVYSWLTETRRHEIEHRKRFHDAMGTRGAKPCRAMFVWRIGGFLLGAGTAILGDRAIFACTAAVEKAVHRHLMDQIAFLDDVDPDLAKINRSILVEEDQHLRFAESKLTLAGHAMPLLKGVVAIATEILILISTRGDSLNLAGAHQRP